MLTAIRRHPVIAGTAGVAVLGFLAWLAFGWFGVQALFLDDEVDDAAPVFASGAGATTPSTDAPTTATTLGTTAPATTAGTTPGTGPATTGPTTTVPAATETTTATPTTSVPDPTTTTTPEPRVVTLVEGSFGGRGDYSVEGTALVLNDGTEQRFLRFEDFVADNGPDLDVYLSAAPADASGGELDDDWIDLGDLRGNIGDQNYELDPSIDLERYSTVVIWCTRFSALFGTAELSPAV